MARSVPLNESQSSKRHLAKSQGVRVEAHLVCREMVGCMKAILRTYSLSSERSAR